MNKISHIAVLAIILSLVIFPLAYAGERSEKNESGERYTESREESNLKLNNNLNKYDSEKQNNQTLSGEISAVSGNNITFKSENETAPCAINFSITPTKSLYGANLQISDLKISGEIRISPLKIKYPRLLYAGVF